MSLVPVTEDDRFDLRGLLQSRYWARLKARFGWTPWFFETKDRENRGELIVVLARRIGPALTLAYVPHAPSDPPGELSPADAARRLAFLGSDIAKALSPSPFCVRFDLRWPRGAVVAAGGVRKAPVDIQPPDTTIVDLTVDEDAILAGMKSRSRRNIRKALKHGVTVRRTDDVSEFYRLYETTAERDRIAIHSAAYYEAVVALSADSDAVEVEVLIAEYRQTPIAAVIVAFSGPEAVYLYGASSNEHRETMPAYALQWEAMRRAKSRGCVEYDLFGIPPSDDPGHPMHGLYRFKTGFGGRIVHRAGCWDYPSRPILYSIYREAERARRFYHKVLKKRPLNR